jgi:NDP-sugar pyrophosphorylase family protein
MDSEEPRGSGGALRDAVQDLDPDGHVLVAPANAYLSDSLFPILSQLASQDADVAIHADATNAPTGFFLFRCGTLAGLPAKGFVDLKEQALPHISARGAVRVLRGDAQRLTPIRTLDGYIRALRAAASPDEAWNDSSEDWRCTFSLSEDGSEVHPTARLHDSVVLAGGRVGAGATVVRSLVGPGGVVAANESVFDELLPIKGSGA